MRELWRAAGADVSLLPLVRCPQRRKLVDFFRPHPEIAGDRGRALRVSRYFAPETLRHVRFSVWSDDCERSRADAAVSLDEDEAARLARFLTFDPEPAPGDDTQPLISGTP